MLALRRSVPYRRIRRIFASRTRSYIRRYRRIFASRARSYVKLQRRFILAPTPSLNAGLFASRTRSYIKYYRRLFASRARSYILRLRCASCSLKFRAQFLGLVRGYFVFQIGNTFYFYLDVLRCLQRFIKYFLVFYK